MNSRFVVGEGAPAPAPFTSEQEARLAEVLAATRGGPAKDPDAALRLACLQIVARMSIRLDPRVAADVLVAYVRTGDHIVPDSGSEPA